MDSDIDSYGNMNTVAASLWFGQEHTDIFDHSLV